MRIASPSSRKAGIDAALEAAARVAGQAERLAGAGDPLGREISDLEHDVGGRFADARILAAHDPADVVDLAVVGDHRHERLERIFLFVERQHLLAVARRARGQAAVQLGDVIGVRGPADARASHNW